MPPNYLTTGHLLYPGNKERNNWIDNGTRGVYISHYASDHPSNELNKRNPEFVLSFLTSNLLSRVSLSSILFFFFSTALTLLYIPIQPQRCKPPQRLTAMVALSTAVLFSLVSLAVASSHHHKMGIRHHRRQTCNANPNSGNGTNLSSGNNTSPPQKGANNTTPLPNGTNSTSPPQNGGNNTSQLQLLDHYHGQDFMNEE